MLENERNLVRKVALTAAALAAGSAFAVGTASAAQAAQPADRAEIATAAHPRSALGVVAARVNGDDGASPAQRFNR